ncbi:MAG TPA: stalk domain-containing protein [Syntrophomonadaceae bacterium]|nr:stalk domain-containing protein [Syntrophomonadaceae bacterium]
MTKTTKLMFVILISALLFTQSGIRSTSAATIQINPGITKTNPGNISPNSTLTLRSPSNLTAESSEIGKVVLHWTDNSTNETGFTIERKSSSDDSYFPIDNEGANVTTYEQNELSVYAVFPGEDYFYRVKAYNNSDSSGYSNDVHIQVMSNIPSPSSPAALRAKALLSDGRLTVRLFWGDTANNEDKYVVQRAKAGGGLAAVAELPANSFKWEEPTDLERKVKYTYRVIAYNAGGAGLSNTADVVLPTGAPVYPVFNYPQALGSTSMELTWSDNSDNEDGFRIERYGDKPANPFTGVAEPDQVYLLDPNVTSLKITGLQPHKKYGFKLWAYNAAGDSICAIADGYTGALTPTGLNLSVQSPNQVTLTWASDVSSNGFSIERKKAGGTYTEIGTAQGTEPTYLDSLLLPNTQYFYRMRSWYQDSYYNRYWSDYSNEIGITTPGQSTNFVQNPNKNQVLTSVNISLKLGDISYQVNGETKMMDIAPITVEGRTMLPIRYLTEPLGAQLDWDENAQKATISLNNKVIEMWIGKNTARVDGLEVMIDPQNSMVTPLTVPPGRTLLPVNFISQNLGCKVNWDPVSQSVSLSYSE